MTRRKHPSQLKKQMPPNPVNIAQKLRRIRIEITAIADSIDEWLLRHQLESEEHHD